MAGGTSPAPLTLNGIYHREGFKVPETFTVEVRQCVLPNHCMAVSSNPKNPIVELKPDGAHSDDLSARALRVRIRQQELLAELGVLALQGTSFVEMLNHTVRVTAEGLGAEYCKVLEYIPADKRL